MKGKLFFLFVCFLGWILPVSGISQAAGESAALFAVESEEASMARLSVEIRDADTGKLTAARVRLVNASGQVAPLPDQAVSISYGHWDAFQGYGFQPDSSFYVDGGFDLELPAGDYTLSLSKGYEYLSEHHELKLESGEEHSEAYRLERWINMPERGWYSADDHIHIRRSPRENPLILNWIAAEDIHVGALLQMGDLHTTYYPQYAWGREGVYQIEEHLLTSGQEEPRTHEIGHTIALGADRFVRFGNEYYFYDKIFDQVHEHGGVTGYAHQGETFHGYRGMALDVLRGKVDFLEILQFCIPQAPLHVKHYYPFLDLGFKLTATAGSDFPWCGRKAEVPSWESQIPRIGNARFYTYIEDEFTFENWISSLKEGHTFVSSGPVLELTVNHHIPGEELEVQPGDTLSIRATARGHRDQVPLETLEIVAHGQVIHRVDSSEAGQSAGQLTVDFRLPAEHGMWIAARTSAGPTQKAHTTPVYVITGEGDFHNPKTASAHLHRIEHYLEEIEAEIEEPDSAYDRQAWRYAEGLRDRIAEVRAIVEELKERFSR